MVYLLVSNLTPAVRAYLSIARHGTACELLLVLWGSDVLTKLQ